LADQVSARTSNVASIPTDDTGAPRVKSLITLARRGMRILGTQTSDTVEKTALEGVLRGIADINMNQLFDFRLTKDTDITLVENTSEYTLPNGSYAIRECVLVDDSKTPEHTRPLSALDWDQLQRLYDQGNTGEPAHWVTRDVWVNGKVQVYPIPDEGAASKYKLRVWYVQRVQAPSINDPNIEIEGPEELTEVIISYVRYHLLMTYDRENRFAIGQAYSEYRDQRDAIKGAENRTKAGDFRIQPMGFSMGRSGRRVGWPTNWES